MLMNEVIAVFLLLLLCKTGFELWLDVLNRNHVRRHADAPPEALREVMPKETYRRAVEYTLAKNRFGMVDLYEREWDEPAGNGGFLFNGGRLYIDMGHIEYCTPECLDAREAVRYDRAGDRLLQTAVAALGYEGRVFFIRNNIDHHTGATFGCHENFSMDRLAPLSEGNIRSLLAFLTLRLVYTGAGRVGAAGARLPIGFPERMPTFEGFQLSQRADYVQNDFYEWVQHNRAIVNTRDEPLADPLAYRRLHLLHGDTNVFPATTFLKLGTTRLVLDLLEEDALPAVVLQDAVSALRSISRRTESPWRVRDSRGRERDVLDLLDRYRLAAHRRFSGRDEETDSLLALWEETLDALARNDPETLAGRIDWVGKRGLLEAFRREQGLDWNDPWMQSQDIEFHHIDPERGLGRALADCDGFWAQGCIESATTESPEGSRAAVRSRLMREIERRGGRYHLDWDRVSLPGGRTLFLRDPFENGAVYQETSGSTSLS